MKVHAITLCYHVPATQSLNMHGSVSSAVSMRLCACLLDAKAADIVRVGQAPIAHWLKSSHLHTTRPATPQQLLVCVTTRGQGLRNCARRGLTCAVKCSITRTEPQLRTLEYSGSEDPCLTISLFMYYHTVPNRRNCSQHPLRCSYA